MARESPFRLLMQKAVRRSSPSVKTREEWDIESKPAYMTGVLRAAKQALAEGADSMSVIEFGVAGGTGLVALQRIAEAVQQDTGIAISVFGFDAGNGLPQLTGDYRDHPDIFQFGDFPMDMKALKARLAGNTRLIVGNVSETVPEFVKNLGAPIGFVSVDLDLYSSARDALRVFQLPGSSMLNRTYLYFDDVEGSWAHRRAGELLAIDEFNENDRIFIDRWRGISNGRVFPNASWHNKMYVAHNLDAISRAERSRQANVLLLGD